MAPPHRNETRSACGTLSARGVYEISTWIKLVLRRAYVHPVDHDVGSAATGSRAWGPMPNSRAAASSVVVGFEDQVQSSPQPNSGWCNPLSWRGQQHLNDLRPKRVVGSARADSTGAVHREREADGHRLDRGHDTRPGPLLFCANVIATAGASATGCAWPWRGHPGGAGHRHGDGAGHGDAADLHVRGEALDHPGGDGECEQPPAGAGLLQRLLRPRAGLVGGRRDRILQGRREQLVDLVEDRLGHPAVRGGGSDLKGHHCTVCFVDSGTSRVIGAHPGGEVGAPRLPTWVCVASEVEEAFHLPR